MKRLVIYLFLLLSFPSVLSAQVTVSGSAGANGTYARLGLAFTAINGAIQTGNNIVITITANTTETATVVLNEGAWSSIIIYPAATGLIISGNLNDPLINLNGADNVIIDGRVNGSGTAIDLTITNINTGNTASTILFTNASTSNTVKDCFVKGSGAGNSTGIFLFSNPGSGSDPNEKILIDNNNITSNGTARPYNAIYSSSNKLKGTNQNIIVSNNNIYDFINPGAASFGINLSSYSTSWSISGNSFYETTSFAPAANVDFFAIYAGSGDGHIISDNFIGGSSVSCGGIWAKRNAFNNTFRAIYINTGTTATSSIQGNTIKSFSWSNSGSANWTGIEIAEGNVNIGTTTGNTIGAPAGTGSITVTGGATGTTVYCINILGAGTVDCQYNIIGSVISSNGPANASNIRVINKTGAGSVNISNNYIGSTSTSNSIHAGSGSTSNTQTLSGINNSGTGTIRISGNTIANITNGTTNSAASARGLINGISSSSGNNTIWNNTIHDLTIANANNAEDNLASAVGIALNGTTLKTISSNTIYNIFNTYSSFAGTITGLYFTANNGPNAVNHNFIHSLSVKGSSSTAAKIYGVKINSGSCTYSNNIISLAGTTQTTIYGIYETGAANDQTNIFFNTIYIGGNPTAGSNQSFALYSAATKNIRTFRNNILLNARSTTGASNLHYAAYLNYSVSSDLIMTNNNYWASGTGGVLGYYEAANRTTLPIVAGLDANSTAINPLLYSPGSTAASNYTPVVTMAGATETGITIDYSGATRTTTPTMGAYEKGPYLWTGTSTTDWNTPDNWNPASAPASDAFIDIPGSLPGYPVIGGNVTIEKLSIGLGGSLIVNSPNILTVTGAITNNAGTGGLLIKSDASGDAKLINNNSAVNASVELYMTGGIGTPGPKFHYFVPPVQSMTIGSSIAEAKTNLSVTTFNGDLLAYDETKASTSTKKGWQFFDGYIGTTPFSTISSAQGYNIYLTSSNKVTFKGQLNAASHTFKLNYTGTNADPGWNLVGNPYPCNYDLNGIAALATKGDNFDNTVYYNHEGFFYYWNVLLHFGLGVSSDIIPQMQGFFVRVTSTGNTLTLPVESKTTTSGDPRSKGFSEPPYDKIRGISKIKLRLENNTQSDETIVCLIDDASPSFDGDYDAFKLFGSSGSMPEIYTALSGTNYAINSVPSPVSEQMIIPLTVAIKQKGTYNIRIQEFENLSGLIVVLKHGEAETYLTENATYTFTSTAGTFTDFQLVFNNNTTGLETLPVTTEKFKSWYSYEYLYINCPEDISIYQGKIEVYDLHGKVVYCNPSLSLSSGETIQELVPLQKGLYITKLIINKRLFSQKIVVM